MEQFDGYEVADDLHVNGRLTLGENIADLGGITIAFDALHEAIGDGRAARSTASRPSSGSSSRTPRCGA